MCRSPDAVQAGFPIRDAKRTDPAMRRGLIEANHGGAPLFVGPHWHA
jgi:hypothetical protein